jgi:hypothetical protein
MALILNSYIKSNLTGIGGMFLRQLNTSSNGAVYLRLYPTTVAYPNAAVQLATSLPLGHAAITGSIGPNRFTSNGTNLIINTGSISVTMLSTCNIGWWALEGINVTGIIVSDSIGLNGTPSIVTVNSMSPTVGQVVSINFTLKVA